MRTMVVLTSETHRDEFLKRFPDAESFECLKRHFIIMGDVSDVILNHGDIVARAEPADAPIGPAYQTLEIESDFSDGSWALARIIRRRAPWRTDYLTFPINTFFECARDGSGVNIYILDSGIRIAHDEFGGRASIIYEYASSGPDGDDYGHGTSVASCAAGSTVGIARGAAIFSSKISINSSGSASAESIISGINAVISHYSTISGPAIANISYISTSSTVSDAVDNLLDVGIIVVAAVGNISVNLSTIDQFPAENPDAIGVAALGVLDIPATYANSLGTNYGTGVAISAPGQTCLIASFTGNSAYRVSGGTSFAAPYVAGVIACMLEGHAKLTMRSQVLAVKSALLDNATTGRLRIPPSSLVPVGALPDAILYLDPTIVAPEPIPGLP